MKLIFTTIALLTANFFTINIYSNDSVRLDSVITRNGHYTKQHKEVFTSGEFGVTKIKGSIWDGSQWNESYVIDYTYDSRGNLLSEMKTMNEYPEYIERKNLFSYDDNNNFLSEEFFLCNSTTQLVGVGKHTYIYDTNQVMKEVVSSTWDPQISSWVEDTRYIYKYDSNQNQTLTEIWKKSLRLAKWEKNTKTERVFNSSNILTEESIFKGVADDWIKTSKLTNELNPDNTIKKTNLFKNNGTNQWINSDQKIYEYSEGKILTMSVEIWDGTNWILHSKEDYSYTGGNLTSIKSSIKKGDNSWIPYMEKDFQNNGGTKTSEYYSFSPKGVKSGIKKEVLTSNSNSSVNENFVWENGAWVAQKKNITTFDSNSRTTSIEKHSNNQEYYKENFEYLSDGRILVELTYDWFRGDWGLGKHVQYYYADTISSIETSKKKPAIIIKTRQDMISIESESPVKNVKVYSIVGELIHNGSDSQINTASWTKAAYIVNVTVRSNEQRTTKVLVN